MQSVRNIDGNHAIPKRLEDAFHFGNAAIVGTRRTADEDVAIDFQYIAAFKAGIARDSLDASILLKHGGHRFRLLRAMSSAHRGEDRDLVDDDRVVFDEAAVTEVAIQFKSPHLDAIAAQKIAV